MTQDLAFCSVTSGQGAYNKNIFCFQTISTSFSKHSELQRQSSCKISWRCYVSDRAIILDYSSLHARRNKNVTVEGFRWSIQMGGAKATKRRRCIT